MDKFDLIIIGGGGAGLAAAHTALENGVKRIALLESLKKTGGNSAMAGGFIYALDTPQLRGSGLNDATRELKAALDFHHYDYVNPALIRRWLNETKSTIAWLESRGHEFILSPLGEGYTHVMADSPGVSWFHHVLRPLTAELEKSGVRFFYQATATEILKRDGKVCGVRAEAPDGILELEANAVLLACGGFMADREQLKARFPQYYSPESFYQIVPSRANGVELAASAGARLNGECTLVKEAGMCFTPGPGRPGRIFGAQGSVFVNRLGRRYVDESLWNQNYSANGMLHQKDMAGYAIYSRETLEHVMSLEAPFDFKSERDAFMSYMAKASEKGEECRFADTLAELARWIGCPAEALEKTVSDYNGYCRTGLDLEFVKPADCLIPLESGPYLAVRIKPMYIDTIGPVVIDESMRVLDRDWSPIPGFYAAGVIAAGWEGRDYMRFGSALSFSVTSGRMAGASIAADLTID